MNERTPHTAHLLSPSGMARRDAMLAELTETMTRVHHTRRVRRRSLGVVAVIAVVGVAALAARPALFRSNTNRMIVKDWGTDIETLTQQSQSRVQLVRTAGSAMDRYIDTPASTVVAIDDDALLHELASMDRSTGLIRRGERVWLTDAVTDAALDVESEDQSPPGDVRRPSDASPA